MPELAEVEAVRQRIDSRLKKRKIKEIVADPSDRYLFAFASILDVTKALKNATVIGTGRKGKYFWIELSKKPWPLFHLGMTGDIIISDEKTEKERLWFCRLILKFDEGLEMAFIDPRRFGRMWLTDDPKTHPRIQKLGFDPLIDFPNVKILSEKLQRRKKAIKAVLLDQNLFAGVGNWLADEILFQAKLSPHHLACDLTPSQIKALHKQVLAVIKKAVSVNADYTRFPKAWLFHHRWGKKKNAQTSRGHKIIHQEVGGRTTAWVPGYQK